VRLAGFTIPAVFLGLFTTGVLLNGIEAEAKSAKHRSKCMRLKGKDRAPARKVKLVQHSNQDNGRDLIGCVLPRGHVYTIASSGHSEGEDESSTYSVLKVKSSTVLVESVSSNGYAHFTDDALVSLRTGRSAPVAARCESGVDTACPSDPPTSAPVVLINKHGRAVVAKVSGAPTITTIVSFSSRGKRVDLDSGPSGAIPAASLTLSGDVASWTHSGQARSAVLSE
jgi:hypothetical protein